MPLWVDLANCKCYVFGFSILNSQIANCNTVTIRSSVLYEGPCNKSESIDNEALIRP